MKVKLLSNLYAEWNLSIVISGTPSDIKARSRIAINGSNVFDTAKEITCLNLLPVFWAIWNVCTGYT